MHFDVIISMCLSFLISVLFLLSVIVYFTYILVSVRGSDWMFVSSSQQEEKDRETPKDSLDDLFPNDEEEHGQGSKKNSIQQLTMML